MDSDRDTSAPDSPWLRRNAWHSVATVAGWTLAGLGIISQAGCMSALTATTLREALRETAASLSTPHELDHASVARDRDTISAAEDGTDDPAAPDDADLEKVIDNAVARLSAAGGIDPPTQQLLIETLERTRPEDWAVVVNEFAASLEESRGGPGAASQDRPAPASLPERTEPAFDVSATTVPPQTHAVAAAATLPAPAAPAVAAVPVAVVAAPPVPVALAVPPAPLPPPAPLDVVDGAAAPIAPLPAAPAVPVVLFIEPVGSAPSAPTVVNAVIAPAASAPALPAPDAVVAAPPAEPVEPPVPEAFEAPAALLVVDESPLPTPGPAINNACFATRVRGWGNVERFPRSAFRPGQEVIVYFELDRLSIRPSDAGHTTSIDTAFRLLDGGGERIGQWSFEPIVETCPSPRRDYFARYFLRIPEDAKAGRHRLEWSVTDAVAGATRQAHLDLDILPAE